MVKVGAADLGLETVVTTVVAVIAIYFFWPHMDLISKLLVFVFDPSPSAPSAHSGGGLGAADVAADAPLLFTTDTLPLLMRACAERGGGGGTLSSEDASASSQATASASTVKCCAANCLRAACSAP